MSPYGDPGGYYMRARSTNSGSTWTNSVNTTLSWALSSSSTQQALGQPYSTTQVSALGADGNGVKNWMGQRFKYLPQAGDSGTGAVSSLAIQLRHNSANPGSLSDDIRVHLVAVKSQAYNGDGTLSVAPSRELYSGVLVPVGSPDLAFSPGELRAINIPEADRPVLVEGESYMLLVETASTNAITQLSFEQGSVAGFGVGATNGNFQGMLDGFVVNSGTFALGSNGLPEQLLTSDLGGAAATIFRDTRFQTKAEAGPRWSAASGGLWSNAANWSQAVPSGAGSIANLASSITTSSVITNDVAHTVGHLVFDSVNGYTIDGSATLTLDRASAFAPTIDVTSGNHSVTAPLALAKNTQVTVNANSTLTASNLATTAFGLSKYGAGTLVLNRARLGSLAIDDGTVSIQPGKSTANTSVVGALSITRTGALNLNDQDLIVQNGSTSAIRASLLSGLKNGSWTGGGINSALAAANSASAHRTAIAYATAQQLLGGAGTFSGQSVAAADVLLSYTYFGDANIDGKVNALDFNALASNFGAADQNWIQGDFNYDGTIDSLDFTALSANFNAAAIPAGALGSLVPEPAALSGVLLGCVALRRSRRRA
jgi:hypothetical protein